MSLRIEYLHKDGLDHPFTASRRDVSGLSEELKVLVGQVRSVGIDVEFIETPIRDDESNDLRINGKGIKEILDGLQIVHEGGCESCDACAGDSCNISVEGKRPETDWNDSVLEDIPELLLKNAISKSIADSR